MLHERYLQLVASDAFKDYDMPLDVLTRGFTLSMHHYELLLKGWRVDAAPSTTAGVDITIPVDWNTELNAAMESLDSPFHYLMKTLPIDSERPELLYFWKIASITGKLHVLHSC